MLPFGDSGEPCLFVCLFVRVNQPVPTAIGSGLLGPQEPVSTTMVDWDLLFIKDSKRGIIERVYTYSWRKEIGGFMGCLEI